MPYMKSLREFRLASTAGHVVQVHADRPTFIPDPLVPEALALGMVVVDEDEISTELDETAEPVELIEEDDDGESGEEETSQEEYLNQALMRIIVREDPDDFKGDGYPKVARVNAELPPEAERVSGTQVAEAFAVLQEDISLAD
jgi:hypothetical protein